MKKLPLIIAIIVAIVAGHGCTPAPAYRQLDGSTWNTLYHIVYRSTTSLDDSIRDIFRQVEVSLSPFVDSSAISLINRGEAMATDTLIRRVFNASRAINQASGGLFDPTVAPLVNLWGFGYRGGDVMPSQAQIDSALMAVGIAECAIDPDGNMVKKTPATEFNFSAITKGMGCDLIAEMFRRNGVADYMVEIGGEIAMQGVNSRRQPWHIQVDKPVINDTAIINIPLMVIAPGDCGIATSGNYRNFKRDSLGNPAFGHTISPVTGRPVMSRVASATIIAPDCMTADALATACMAMNPDSALAMINRLPDVHALLVFLDGDTLTTATSPAFPRPN